MTTPTPTHANLVYATRSPDEVLDLWLPPRLDGPFPVMIYVHGGAFMFGDKEWVAPKVGPLLDAGFAVASVNYRLSGEATFPAAPQDLKAAVRWLRANAGTYDLDPGRFAAWGESAGGHLVAMLGTTGGQHTILDDASLGNPEVSSAVQAVIDWYGPIDFLLMDRHASEPGNNFLNPQVHDLADSPESLYLGAPIQTIADIAEQSNPVTYVAAARQLPMFAIAHGDADNLIASQQSVLLADALRGRGADVTLTILRDAVHADPRFDDELMAFAIAWARDALETIHDRSSHMSSTDPPRNPGAQP
jgi:acetyl esterase/lipase